MFVYYGNLRQPPFPHIDQPSAVWRGLGEDVGWVCFHIAHDVPVMGHETAYHLYANSKRLDPVFVDVYGYGYWEDSDGVERICNTPSGWYYSSSAPMVMPREWDEWTAEQVPSGEEMVWVLSSHPAGDRYWTGEIPAPGTSTNWTPRGSLRNSPHATLTVSAEWDALPRVSATDAPFPLGGYAGLYMEGGTSGETSGGTSAVVGPSMSALAMFVAEVPECR